VEGVIGGRAMTHPRQTIEPYTVYNMAPGRQPEFELVSKIPLSQGSCHPLIFLVE
jgi:hypothetical protein